MDDNAEHVAIAALLAMAAAFAGEEENVNEEEEGAVGVRQRRRAIYINVDEYRYLDDQTFLEHFRMRRYLFEELLRVVGNHLLAQGRIIRLRTPLDLCLMMSLWILATQDSFRSVAVKFGVPSRGTVHFHYVAIIEALREMSPRFIQWPDPFERDNIKSHFERRYGYPGVVGCIDGSHIYISAPVIQAQRYVNRFKKFSVLLRAVCDHRMVIRDIYVGQPGSVHDARMFQRSPLSYSLLHNRDMIDPDEHIIGDGAYTLTDKVMTPYRVNGRFNRRRRRHNFRHASARSAIERAFALLKAKWRRQKYMLAYSLHYVIDSIVASCVLHNFILLDGHQYEQENNINLQPEELVDNPQNGDGPVLEQVDPALREAQRAGKWKREFIAHLIHPGQ